MEAVCDGKIEPKIIKQVQSGRGSSANSAAKFFIRNKLDYPNNETQRASRKYVKAMKHLNVSWLHSICGKLLTAGSGIHPIVNPVQQAAARLITEDLRIRSEAEDNCQAGFETPVVQRVHSR